MNFKELKKWYKFMDLGFHQKERLAVTRPDVLEAFENELAKNTGRVGCYVYHSHVLVNDKLEFDGMKIGYYIRSKNPFSWRFHKTYGNE